MGYHKDKIDVGVYGEFSKVEEEFQELKDSIKQDVKILQLVELSDLYGAIEGYIEKYHKGLVMSDLKQMSDLTKSAFKEGER